VLTTFAEIISISRLGHVKSGSSLTRHFPPRFDEKPIRRFVIGALSLRELMVVG
jgi:hypothetical protein